MAVFPKTKCAFPIIYTTTYTHIYSNNTLIFACMNVCAIPYIYQVAIPIIVLHTPFPNILSCHLHLLSFFICSSRASFSRRHGFHFVSLLYCAQFVTFFHFFCMLLWLYFVFSARILHVSSSGFMSRKHFQHIFLFSIFFYKILPLTRLLHPRTAHAAALLLFMLFTPLVCGFVGAFVCAR